MVFYSAKYIFAINMLSIILRSSAVLPTIKKQNDLIMESKLTIEQLNNTLIYLKKNPDSLLNDVVFGLLITRANLQWAVEHFKFGTGINLFFLKKLWHLILLCNEVINLNKTKSLPVLDNYLWNYGAEDLKIGYLSLQNREVKLPRFDSCDSINTYMMKGTPDNSDFCISELISNTCQVSEECWFSETNRNFHAGYKTSHRLIYLQIATKLSCDRFNPKKFFFIRRLKKNLCQQMLLEAKALHEDEHFSLTRDLFLEHIALCGLEGYSEFANAMWRNEIRSWQSEEGCFGRDMNLNNCSAKTSFSNLIRQKLKRTDLVINNCHTHVTAVAVSAMAFHLRFLLDSSLLLN